MLGRLVRFSITGVGSTLVHVGTAIGLIEFSSIGPTLSNGIAFCVATLFSIFINSFWSFSTQLSKSITVRYLFVAFIAAILSMAIAAVGEYFNFHYLFGIFVIVLVVPLVTFCAHNFWTYK